MAWSRVQSASKAATASAVTTVSLAYGTNVSAGTKLIALVVTSTQTGTTTTTASVKDAALNSWTLIGRKSQPSTGTILADVSLWALDTPAGDVGTKPTLTATLSGGTANMGILIQEVSGLLAGNTTAMADGTLAGLGGAATGTTGSPAYTSTAASEYLVSCYGDDGGPISYTKPAALTADANSLNTQGYANTALAYGNSTDGAEAGSWTLTGSAAEWATLLVAFKLGGTAISGADAGTGTDTATVAVTYYVSPSGSDSNSGLSASAPWQTVAKVNAATLIPGDTVLFQGGQTFTGTMLQPGQGGTASYPVTFGSYGTGQAAITTSASSAIYAYEVGGIVVENLTITGPGASTAGAGGYVGVYFNRDVAGYAPPVTVTNCTITGWQYGVLVTAADAAGGYSGITITGNSVSANRDAGINVAGSGYSHQNVTVTGNSAFNQTGYSGNTTTSSGHGIVVGNANGGTVAYNTAYGNGGSCGCTTAGPVGIWGYTIESVVFEYNVSYGNLTASPGNADGDGFDLDDQCVGCVLQYNIAYENAGFGIACYSDDSTWSGNVIRYNITWGNSVTNPDTAELGLTGGAFADCDIYGNTFTGQTNAELPSVVLLYGATFTSVNLWNNIFYTAASGVSLIYTDTAYTGVTFQGNLYYSAAPFLISWGGTSYSTMAAWQTATGQEKLSGGNTGLQADPLLVAPGTAPAVTSPYSLAPADGLHLQSGSPAALAGLNIQSLFSVSPGSRDYFGDALSVPLWIGAYQGTAVSWNVIQSAKTAATATYATTGACTFGTNLTAGTKIIAAVSVSLGAVAAVTGVTDGNGNSLTLIGRETTSSAVDVSLWALDTPAGDAGTKPTITATLGASNGQFSIGLLEVSGLAAGNTTAAMLDGTLGGKTGTGGSSTGSPSYTSTAASEFLVSAYGDDGGPETFTKPSALTLASSNVNTNSYADCAIAYGNSTDGTEAGSWTLTGSSADWATLLSAFKLAGAGATTVDAADAGTGTDTATVNIGGRGYDTGSGTDAASVTAQTTSAPVFAASYSPAGATSLAVTAAQSGTGVSPGMALTVKVLTSANGSPIGAIAESTAVTTPELAITPSGTGSWVYGALVNDSAAATFTAAANTTFSQNQYWSGDAICFGTFRSTGTTTASTPVTLGATAPAETASNLQIALLEILVASAETLAEDPSSPAVAYTTTATTVSTAAFAPPAGALLVAMVASDCTGTSGQAMTMGISDSSGLTWTRQETANYVNGTGTFQSATVWTAVAGSSSGSDWTTAASPKTQSVSASPGNVIVMLGGTQTAATTLAAPTGGPASWTAGGASAVTGYCAGYGWAMAVPGLSQGGGTGTGGGGTVTGGGTASAVAVTTVSLPTAQVSQAYSVTLAATGGTGTPYTWTVTSGSLPAGLSLAAATGVISGTPSGSAATDDITVTATDPGGNSASAPLVMTVITGPSSGPSGSWKLAFADEFDVAYPTPYGTGPNPNVWSDRLLNGDMGRNEGSPDQEWFPHGYYGHSVANSVWTGTIAYQNPGTIDPTITSALSVDAGNATTGLEFTAANISSFPGYSHTYGYVEARIQQPAPGSVHCAWWMLTRGGTWPPEIDIAEWQNSASNTGKDDNAYYNMASTWQTTYYSGDSSSYHVYGCEVTATTVTFYRDGTVTSTQSYDGNARPWFMMVGAGVNGASGGSGYPAAYNVDYIRAWVPSGVPAAPVITAISPATGIPSGGDVAVTFGAVSGATSYRVTASPTDSIQDNIDNYGNGGDGIPGPYTATGSSSPLTVTGIPAGRWNFTVAAINSTGYSPESAPAGPQIINIQMVTAVLPGATAGAAYSATLAAQAGVTPYTWAISSGTLPAGLTLGASTGVISGTPAAAGASEFTVKVSGNTGWSGGATVANSATAALSITTGTGTGGGTGPGTTTLSITTTSLPAATVGTTYSEALTATGGTATGYTWTVSAGSLPAWASLNASTGVISGDPAAAGTSSFTVKVTDSGSNTATQALAITASAATSTAPVGPPGSWTLVFEDDFPGTSLNTSNWTALQGANINNLTTQASAVSVSGGYLRVAYGGAVNSNPANDDYGSGSDGPVLAVGDCCEAMINFPGPSGDTAYNWPAWWAAGGSWPANGEEDIWESYNGTPSAFNYHSHTGANNGPFPSGSWCNSFHTYTLVRGASSMEVYWDGVLERTVTPNDSGGPQSLLINCGSGNTADESAVILVEYVRMWTPG